MRAIDVVSDASVALAWFVAAGKAEVDEARRLVTAHQKRQISLRTLDLTTYELGNALLRGHAAAGAAQVAVAVQALAEICPSISPDADDLATAAELAERHGLTLYDAAYGAVARRRGAALATLDRELIAAGLGLRPSGILAELGA